MPSQWSRLGTSSPPGPKADRTRTLAVFTLEHPWSLIRPACQIAPGPPIRAGPLDKAYLASWRWGSCTRNLVVKGTPYYMVKGQRTPKTGTHGHDTPLSADCHSCPLTARCAEGSPLRPQVSMSPRVPSTCKPLLNSELVILVTLCP